MRQTKKELALIVAASDLLQSVRNLPWGASDTAIAECKKLAEELRETMIQWQGNCSFQMAMRGSCGNVTSDERSFCDEHADAKCKACGTQAIRECDMPLSYGVCGEPLCEKCRCTKP